MDIDLYSDPSCPWCWTATQWLRTASENRAISLRCRPFSLELLGKPAAPPVVLARRWSLRALRVATSLCDEAAFRFLDEFSRALFDPSSGFREPDLGGALERADAPQGLAFRAEETWRDDMIRASMQAAAEARGLPLDQGTTVPILVLHTASGPIAMDGPLLDPAPSATTAAVLWDAISVLATAEEMYGATRPRSGPHSTVAALTGAVPNEGQMP